MKIRNGFVSNSSSSSFIVSLKLLTEEQIDKIVNHIEESKKDEYKYKGFYNEPYNEWSITIDEEAGFLEGYTTLDNFDMYEFLILVGVPEKYVRFYGS